MDKNNKNYMIKLTFIIFSLYIFFALHIFVLPDDILDKFPFLGSYVDFMKEHFAVIKQIELRTENFKQVATLWASNILISTIFFFIAFIKLAVLNIKIGRNWISIAVRDNKILKLFLYVIIAFIFIINGIKTLNSGTIFDTSIHGYEKVNNINSPFGLFFFGGMLHLGFLIFCIGFTVVLYYILKILNNKIQNYFNTKDKK